MQPSAIAWTDYSGGIWNIVTGCTPADRSCANCYARAIYRRFGREFGTVRMHPDKLERWSTAKLPTHSPKRGAPHRPMVFVVDTGDLFHEDVPDATIEVAFGVMLWRKDVIWQVLTKRPRRMAHFVTEWLRPIKGKRVPGNIWLGTSICDQETADERIVDLLDTPAAVRFVSVEPMLTPVDLTGSFGVIGRQGSPHIEAFDATGLWMPKLSWVVCGGESGPHRRPFDVTWALDLYEQCRMAQVPFFYKQGSALHPGQNAVLPGHGVVQEWPEEGGR